ncbi:MAG: hypothetical protein AAF889_11650 [Cyanobacteria bacterium P01_D01_bin.73]
MTVFTSWFSWRSPPYPFAKKLLAIAGIGALLASCAPSRAVQCQRLSEIARAVQETAQPAVSGRTQAIARAATGFTAAIDQLNQLGNLDEDLTVVQVALRNVYGNSGDATSEFLTALEARDRSQAETAVKRLEELATQEKDALEQLNRRCYPEGETTEGEGTNASPKPTATESP